MNEKPNSFKSSFFSSFFLHIHPKKVSAEALRFTLSFGLGGMAATLVFLLFISGIFQIFLYTPDTTEAYGSILSMYERGTFGGWTRNIHYWSANLLVVITFCHCCRVFLTGAFAERRRSNWFVGLFLFGLVLFANFSGYLLPWDQLAFWAVTIFTSMIRYLPFIGEGLVQILRGGSEIGPSTLSNFYTLHTTILPFCFVVILIFHFWQIRKAGGLATQEKSKTVKQPMLPVVPDLIARELALGLSLIAVILLFSSLFDAPIDQIANPGMSPNPSKAAWFFMGLQELLLHLHPTYAVCVVPLLVMLFLIVLPYLPNASLPHGIWFGGRKGMSLAIKACIFSGVFTFLMVVIDEKFRFARETGLNDFITGGIVPILGMLFIYIGGYFFLRKKHNFSLAETLMASFVFSVTGVICLTIIGIWFRGPGMRLLIFS